MNERHGVAFRLALHAPREVRQGERVAATLVVHNDAPDSRVLYLTGRPVALDLIVQRDGQTVWQRLRGAVIPAILQARELPAGGSLSFEVEWDQRTDAGVPAGIGDYQLRGAILTDEPQPLTSADVPLRIVART